MDLVSAEVGQLLDVVRPLTEAQWDLPSACDGLRVRDVVMHLVLARRPMEWRTVRALAHGPGFVRLAGQISREEASAAATRDMITGLEHVVRSPRAGFLARMDPPDNMLADHATHVQDVRFGLNQRAVCDPDRARAVLDAAVRLWRPVTWGTRQRARGLHLQVPECGWEHGAGPVVTGPYDGLLLALGGRRAGLEVLDGPGLQTLASRMPEPEVA